MHVHPEIRGPLMTVGNYLGAANAYVIILTNDRVCRCRGFSADCTLVFHSFLNATIAATWWARLRRAG